MAMLEVSGISKTYHKGGIAISALKAIDFKARPGEFVCLVGPNGCGKSTLLKMIAGIQQPSTGSVGFEGALSYVPQQSSLLPWRTVRDNISLPAVLRGKSLELVQKDVDSMLKAFGLIKFADFYPTALSGGMQQKVSLLRAIITKPQLLLLDEPFSWLDALTRQALQTWLLELWHQEKPTIVCVTHDIREALLLADTVYVLSERPGEIVKRIHVGLRRPRDLATAKAAKLEDDLRGLLA